MDKKIWENQYPKMPELFHLAVEQAVNRAVGTKQDTTAGKLWRGDAPTRISVEPHP